MVTKYFVLLFLFTLVLSGCKSQDPIDPCEANPDALECQPLPCESEPEGCQEARLLMTTTLKPSAGATPAEYQQGESFIGEMKIWIDDPDKTIRLGSIFINIVECTHPEPPRECYTVVQRSFAEVFDQDQFSVEPELFNKTYAGDQLRSGLTVAFDGNTNRTAKPAKYSLAIQLFECTNTNPNNVGSDKKCPRIGLVDYSLVIVN